MMCPARPRPTSLLGVPRRNGLPTTVALASLAVLSGLVLYLAGRPLATADLWWHLAMGKIYAAEGLELTSDPLSHTAIAAPEPHQWLFGVSLHALDRVAGHYGLRVAHVLGVAGILALAFSIFRRESRSIPAACCATGAVIVLSWWRLLQFRPDLVSIAATLGLYRLLLEENKPPSWRRIAGALAILVVWANCHALVAIGPALLIAALLGCILEALLRGLAARRAGAQGELKPASDARGRRLALALFLSALATLLNPRGLEQPLTFFRSAGSSALWQVQDEWTRFDPTGGTTYGPAVSPLALFTADVILVGFAIAVVFGLVQFLRRPSERTLRRIDPVLLGLGLAGFVALAVAIRFLWLGFFPLLFVMRAQRVAGGDGTAAPRAWAFALLALSLAAAYPLAGGFRSVAPPLSSYLSEPYDNHKFYGEGVAFLRDAGVEGRLYNSYSMGGFAAYWLAPQLTTFVDGRMNFPDDVLSDYRSVRIQRGAHPGESFLDVLERRGVDLFFGVGVPNGLRNSESTIYTTTNLERSTGWLLVSRSLRHAIYLRENPRNLENLARIASYYEQEGVPFDPERGLDVGEVIRGRPDWAVAHALLPRNHDALVAASRSGIPAIRAGGIEALALMRALAGAYADQVELDREATALRPRAKAPRRRLVAGLLRLDRPEQARAVARELVAIDIRDRRSRAFARVAGAYLEQQRAALLEDRPPAIPLDAPINSLRLVD